VATLRIPLAQFHAHHTFNNGQVFGWFAASVSPLELPKLPDMSAVASPKKHPQQVGRVIAAGAAPPAGPAAPPLPPSPSKTLSPIRLARSTEVQSEFDSATFHGVVGCPSWAAQVSVSAEPPAPGTPHHGHALVRVHAVLHPATGASISVEGPLLDSMSLWLGEYLSSSVDMRQLHRAWTCRDETLHGAVGNFPGMRILQQDVWECLLCFLCSSNNNIPRIRQMLAALRRTYGHPFPGEALHGECSHSLPTIASLAAAPEDDLRSLGLGYRAKFIRSSAGLLLSAAWRQQALPVAKRQVQVEQDKDSGVKVPRKSSKRARDATSGAYEGGSEGRAATNAGGAVSAAGASGGLGVQPSRTISFSAADEAAAHAFLLQLREQPEPVVQAVLTQLPGVGRKVADCVALFSCACVGAVPVDTHVWRIAVRDMDSSLAECKSLTPRIYRRVGALFRNKYGRHAGWAHSLLFAREIAK
jgi:N-glycosylase/DNA lyase